MHPLVMFVALLPQKGSPRIHADRWITVIPDGMLWRLVLEFSDGRRAFLKFQSRAAALEEIMCRRRRLEAKLRTRARRALDAACRVIPARRPTESSPACPDLCFTG